MFIFCENTNKENTDIIQYIQSHHENSIQILHSENEIEHIAEKDILPSVLVIFVENIAKTTSLLEKIHHIFNQKNHLTYTIAIAENNLNKEIDFFTNSFEAYFFKPANKDAILKEIKKASNFIHNVNQNLKIEKPLIEELSSIIKSKDNKPEYLFETDLTGVGKLVHKAKENQDIKQNQSIYRKIEKNIVWPGKVIIKNPEPNIIYNEKYFELNETTNELQAKMLGFIELKYGQIEFIPAIEISTDLMSASSFIFPIGGLEEKEGITILFQGIQNAGITRGIRLDLLNNIYHNVFQNKSIEYIEIAEGQIPQNGHSEYIELIKKKEEKIGKIIDKIGTIDYREHSDIINVKKGEVIAKKIPEKPAIEGWTITGRTLPASFENKKTYNIGENIEENNNGELIAKTEGMLVFENNTIHLKETLVIKGDVNLKTGNIHSNKNVIIRGNVEPGMYVEAKGNIVIKGTVEDSKIVAGGIIEAHGFTGSGKTWVFAKGSITMDFAQNSHIEALGNIIFKKFIVNCEVMTTDKIIGEEKSKAIGGKLEAAKGVELYDLGNEQEVSTRIVLGVNFYNERVISKLLDRISQLKKEKEHIVSILKDYLDLSKPIDNQLKNMKKEDSTLLIKKINELKEKHQLILKLEESFKNLTKNVKEEFTAKAIVHNKIYPGIDITIAGLSRKIAHPKERIEIFFSPTQADIILSPLL